MRPPVSRPPPTESPPSLLRKSSPPSVCGGELERGPGAGFPVGCRQTSSPPSFPRRREPTPRVLDSRSGAGNDGIATLARCPADLWPSTLSSTPRLRRQPAHRRPAPDSHEQMSPNVPKCPTLFAHPLVNPYSLRVSGRAIQDNSCPFLVHSRHSHAPNVDFRDSRASSPGGGLRRGPVREHRPSARRAHVRVWLAC